MYNTTYLSVQCTPPPHTCQYNVQHHHIPVSIMYDNTTYLSVQCITPHTCQFNRQQAAHGGGVAVCDREWCPGDDVDHGHLTSTSAHPQGAEFMQHHCCDAAVFLRQSGTSTFNIHTSRSQDRCFPSTFALQGHKTGIFHQHLHFKVTRQVFSIHIHTSRSQGRHFPLTFTLKVTRQAFPIHT